MEERWAAVLAPAGATAPQQRILTVAAHTPGEAVGSPARVLGSGELKFKYLNPNTLLVAVGEPRNGRIRLSDGASSGPRLTVTLLDVVSGRVLFSQTHEVRPPVVPAGIGRAAAAGARINWQRGSERAVHRPAASAADPFFPAPPCRMPPAPCTPCCLRTRRCTTFGAARRTAGWWPLWSSLTPRPPHSGGVTGHGRTKP